MPVTTRKVMEQVRELFNFNNTGGKISQKKFTPTKQIQTQIKESYKLQKLNRQEITHIFINKKCQSTWNRIQHNLYYNLNKCREGWL